MRRFLAGALVLAAAACASSEQSAVGIVTSVEGAGLGQVASFTLRTGAGDAIRFVVGPVALTDGAFPPDHLREHMAVAEAITVTYRQENGRLVATSLADATAVPK